MALARFGRQAKRPYGLCVKMTAVAVLGLCFIFVWSIFASPSSSLTTQRESFDDIGEPASAGMKKVSSSSTQSEEKQPVKHETSQARKEDKKVKVESDSEVKGEKKVNGSANISGNEHESRRKNQKEMSSAKKGKVKPKSNDGRTIENGQEGEESEDRDSNEQEVQEVVDGKEEEASAETEVNGLIEGDDDLDEQPDQVDLEKVEDESNEPKTAGKKRKRKGPLFDPKMHYVWKLCSTRSKHNYIPCIDNDSVMGRLQAYRHTERSCPRTPPMCLVPLPHEGYETPVPWSESKSKIFYKNVAHPKLAAYVKKHTWVVESGEHLTFPQNQSEFKGGVLHYLESIEEMVPDIEWGKNIRVVLDIGCTDSSFGATLLDKDVLTLTLGLKDDLIDLAQVALERGFPAFVTPFAHRRIPFPSGVFDAIHCGSCSMPWHSNGGKLLLEMNRILRPGGYFILSSKHDSIEDQEAMTRMTASVCWNILADKSDEVSEVGVKIYQKPESNDIYELRMKKNPPLCKENENPDAAWYVPMKTCLHNIPSAIEQHGTEWPEEWPKRLQTYPDWMNDKEKLIADTDHWKAIVDKSYLTGMGIDWSHIRNVMDMKAVNGGFAAALSQQNVWVMNVIPVHAPDTLPIIYERGLIGIYHDWCESFGTYPRSYDLLHADHLFSRLKNRCKEPVSIVVEMDRILRPGGWTIIRDKVEILDPLEGILRSLQWDIRMTYAQNKEGILCAQKTLWWP
ncbi:methyltransferase PMT28 [Tripterygium wilfordii]|uniref:Methyltransferase n=1 Tax=Tripterygium wilfordii TaxID=458696 RepID=A0A7J7DL69_TRIWF|nr:probable methyltransferase PMT28 [Tripterygium wilfordii]KAF5747112.1 methyltransferase PMT28 [Tripterygium wilfordii]